MSINNRFGFLAAAVRSHDVSFEGDVVRKQMVMGFLDEITRFKAFRGVC